MTANKVSQETLRQMMQKMKAEKGETAKPDIKRKYKLSAKEIALMEQEKRKKREETVQEKKDMAKKAGVPENFFDSAKTKAFLNLNKAPQKSILKNSSKSALKQESTSSANDKATGKEWTSRAPVLTVQAGPKQKKDKSPSSQKTLLRTPSGGVMAHLEDEMPADFFDNKSKTKEESEIPADFFDKKSKVREDSDKDKDEADKEGDLPVGFFDDPVQDAKARGIEYKNPDDLEWETFQKEIAAEVRESAEIAAEEQLEETTGRQLEEIDEQMRAWSRVRDAELRKDVIEEKLNVKKEVIKKEEVEDSDEELEEEDLENFLDWRIKKLS